VSAAAIPDRLLTADELAEILNVPVSWVREHTRSGLIPHIELGRYRRYRLGRVMAWLEEQEARGAAWRKHRPKVDA
jgi:excisionase family DNA binding protein